MLWCCTCTDPVLMPLVSMSRTVRRIVAMEAGALQRQAARQSAMVPAWYLRSKHGGVRHDLRCPGTAVHSLQHNIALHAGVCALLLFMLNHGQTFVITDHCYAWVQAVMNIGPGYWAVVLLNAEMTGFNGALSTVSTLVNEVSHVPCQSHFCCVRMLARVPCKNTEALCWLSARYEMHAHTPPCLQVSATLRLPATLFLVQWFSCSAAKCVFLPAQISTMSAELPDRLHAIWYPVTSIVSALLLGIAIYGGPAWARM